MIDDINNQIASIVLAGGKGTRLFPLTLHHCKPAVAYGGKYRLIDIPISNSIHSNIRRIFVLAQYLTTELEKHLQTAYHFDQFSFGQLHFISPEENPNEKVWFEGTADAVRKSLSYLEETPVDYFLILSGDQLYNIDFTEMLAFAKTSGADLTIATLPVEESMASRLGIMKVDSKCNIVDFVEKPEDPSTLENFRLPEKISNKSFLGSMGIYIFKKEALISLLHEDTREDFGKHLIPTQIKKGKTSAYIYDGYWEDIGTIKSYYHANLALTDPKFSLNLYNDKKPIYTTPSFLSGPKVTGTKITNSVICDGTILEAKEIHHSIIGLRSHVGEGTVIKDSVLLGNHFYHSPLHQKPSVAEKANIGKNCLIENTIIDEDVQIEDDVKLINKDNLEFYDGDGIYIRDKIIIVSARTTLKKGFVL